MVVRLAFSIATSVDPDILIIDEALSVGDQYFQKKCIDRMMSFRDSGKILVFCSHAMVLVNLLCQKAIWLDHGKIRKTGDATRVTAAYENYSREKETASRKSAASPNFDAAPPIRIRSITLNGREESVRLRCRDELRVGIEYEARDDRPFWLAAGIRRNDGLICHAVSMSRDMDRPLSGKGVGKVELTYFSLPFFHGEFAVVGSVLDDTGIHCYHQKQSAPFFIMPPEQWNNEMGLLDLPHAWRIL